MKQINNILVWSLKQKLLYTDKVNKLFCVDPLESGQPEKYSLNYLPSYFYQLPDNGYIIVDNLNHPMSIYAEKKLLPFEVKEVESIDIQKQDTRYLALYTGEMRTKKYQLFDWVKKEIKLESEYPFTVIKDSVFNIIDEVLHNYNLNGELNWRYDPDPVNKGKERKEIKNLIGIYGHELWIQLNDKSFVVLNTVTGTPLFPPMNLKEALGLEGLAIGSMHLDEISGKLRILAFLYYIEIDLTTHTAEIKKKFDEGWNMGVGRFYDGDVRVYFISDYPKLGTSIGNNTAGIFNTQTGEIEWYYTLPAEDKYHFFVDEPQASEKYFGVRDTNKILYLFERGKQ